MRYKTREHEKYVHRLAAPNHFKKMDEFGVKRTSLIFGKVICNEQSGSALTQWYTSDGEYFGTLLSKISSCVRISKREFQRSRGDNRRHHELKTISNRA